MAQQTIQPTLVAGFNQLYDDFNGTKADQVAAGLDIRATPDLAVGLEGIYRDLSPPRVVSGEDGTDVLLRDAKEAIAQAYLYWTATNRISASLELRGSRFRQHENDSGGDPQGINTILAPLSVRYFDPSGFFAIAGAEYVSQSVTRQDSSGSNSEKWGDAWLFDAALGYRLPNRYGVINFGSITCSTREFIGRTILSEARSSKIAGFYRSNRDGTAQSPVLTRKRATHPAPRTMTSPDRGHEV